MHLKQNLITVIYAPRTSIKLPISPKSAEWRGRNLITTVICSFGRGGGAFRAPCQGSNWTKKSDEKPAISALFRTDAATERVQRTSRSGLGCVWWSKTGGTRKWVKETLTWALIMIDLTWKWLTSRLPGNVTQINYYIKAWQSWPLLSRGAAPARLQDGDPDLLLHSITLFQLSWWGRRWKQR